jgi:hypothetical protein
VRLNRSTLLCLALLLLAILLPYHRLATFRGLVITDDGFSSDLANGEFPIKAAVGQALKSGELPLWCPDIGGGFPLIVAGTDVLTWLCFGLFPPLIALNLYMLLVLLIAAWGTYGYARKMGSGYAGALLSGIAFAYSGYMVCQWKHLGIVSTICWFPVALLLLESALSGQQSGSRFQVRPFVPYALVFGVQILAGFPQSAYICGLFYSLYALLRTVPRRRWALLFSFITASIVAAALGAVLLLPMWELGTLSDRSGQNSLDWASDFAYWPRNVLTFFVPYINGDISDLSYKGKSVFWEDYGYVGLVTILLAFLGIAGGRRQKRVWFWCAAGALAYLIVLGPATPVFGLFHRLVPGAKMFRFPTRFLFVVDFALVVLAGIGLTRLEQMLARTRTAACFPRLPLAACSALVALAVGDLLHFQLRQNAIVDAKKWLAPPATAQRIREDHGRFRVYSLDTDRQHLAAFQKARGWSRDLAPYVELRELLQPNINLLWSIRSAGCYLGIYPRTLVEVWGGHNSDGIVQQLACISDTGIRIDGLFFRLLSLFNVRYLLSPGPIDNPAMEEVKADSGVKLYRLKEACPRAFFVTEVERAADERDAFRLFAAPDFDPAKRAILHDGTPARFSGPANATVNLAKCGNNEVVVEVTAGGSGYLILTDTWYPGWVATLDGTPTGIYRANFNQRAVQVRAGRHTVRFRFAPRSARLGGAISALALILLLVAQVRARREPRLR